MTTRKTIMVDEDVWDAADKFKHRICVRSIGEAITAAIDSALSNEYYVGIHQEKDGSLYVESVGKTEGEALRNLLNLHEEDFDALRERDVYPEWEVPENRDCYFVCPCEKRFYMDLVSHLSFEDMDEYIRGGDKIFRTCILDGEKGKREALSPALGYPAALVDRNTNRVIQVAESSPALDGVSEEDAEGDLAIYPATNELYAESLIGTQIFCTLKDKKSSNPLSIFAVGSPEFKLYAVVRINTTGAQVIGIGNSGNSAFRMAYFVDFFGCMKGDDSQHIFTLNRNWDATNADEWMLEVNGGQYIVIPCTPELYSAVLVSPWYRDFCSCLEGLHNHKELPVLGESPVNCRLIGEPGHRIADIL